MFSVIRRISVSNASSIDPDQTPHSASSDLGLHYLRISLFLLNARHKCVKHPTPPVVFLLAVKRRFLCCSSSLFCIDSFILDICFALVVSYWTFGSCWWFHIWRLFRVGGFIVDVCFALVISYWMVVLFVIYPCFGAPCFGASGFTSLSAVISRRCLDVARSSMLTFIMLPHWNITPRHFTWYSTQTHYTETELTSSES